MINQILRNIVRISPIMLQCTYQFNLPLYVKQYFMTGMYLLELIVVSEMAAIT